MNFEANPFFLDDEAIEWVKNTIKNMTLEEKIGQLFLPIGLTTNKEYLDQLVSYHIGGLFFRPLEALEVQKVYKYVQEKSKIPLLTAANLEEGGNGATIDGTAYANQMAIAATQNFDNAYILGQISATDAKEVGVNWGFSPVCDIDFNFRNPITNVRTYGDQPNKTIEYAKRYIKAFHDNNLMTSIKHFPGDGVDERDQHLLTSINSLSLPAWKKTYGKIYQALIDFGTKAVMVGHIAFPAYSGDTMPATLSPKLLEGLLRKDLGFNGLIITDSTAMAGFCSAMSRRQAIPYAIQAGCDMILFDRDLEEDIQYMKKGLEEGILTESRLNDAIERILATKASIGLHKKINHGCAHLEDFSSHQEKIADDAITLVKDDAKLLPLNSIKHKRILLEILGDANSSNRVLTKVKTLLEENNFEVTVYQPEANFSEIETVNQFIETYDAVLYIANIETTSNQTVARINWHTFFGLGNNIPWFANEIPTILISFGNPYHIFDMPMVPTVVNSYCNFDHFIEATINKLLGKSEFKGKSPTDVTCSNIALEKLNHENM